MSKRLPAVVRSLPLLLAAVLSLVLVFLLAQTIRGLLVDEGVTFPVTTAPGPQEKGPSADELAARIIEVAPYGRLAQTEPKPEPEEPRGRPIPQVDLLGVFSGTSPPLAVARVQGRLRLLTEGDQVSDGVTLSRVAPDFVVLESGKAQREFRLPRKPAELPGLSPLQAGP